MLELPHHELTTRLPHALLTLSWFPSSVSFISFSSNSSLILSTVYSKLHSASKRCGQGGPGGNEVQHQTRMKQILLGRQIFFQLSSFLGLRVADGSFCHFSTCVSFSMYSGQGGKNNTNLKQTGNTRDIIVGGCNWCLHLVVVFGRPDQDAVLYSG